ncbi:MAG: saccharopine dehydrogenase NADP-binding domain-containing protein [Leptospiraceae bacterium]|nr:saccharopine dehydrogenase NADP-binding domain-containing protein [Leptospiraceae bacterium]MCP5501110.1 saccharopine dehydrogenase NADP-binding domain-containing protein [Leptospiraceae bacterium]
MEFREKQVIVYGASGFTGKLVSEYFAKLQSERNLSFGIAGRDKEKLLLLQKHLKERFGEKAGPDIYIASLESEAELVSLCKKTSVIIHLVGPYAFHGELMVKACIAAGTDYLDITGEPAFVNKIEAQFHSQALEKGVSIVNCCGFDSIPADLGTYFTVLSLSSTEEKQVKCYVEAKGHLSGGTLVSALHAVSENPGAFLENHTEGNILRDFHYSETVSSVAIPLPVIDPLIVLRSAEKIRFYGKPFSYGQYVAVRSVPDTILMSLAASGLFVAARINFLKNYLLSYIQRGEGPSEEKRRESYFQCTFEGIAGKDRVVTRISGGDPGYEETARMVSEAAILLTNKNKQVSIPSGVVTPAYAFGDYLVDALKKIGIKFEILERKRGEKEV